MTIWDVIKEYPVQTIGGALLGLALFFGWFWGFLPLVPELDALIIGTIK